MKVSTIAWYFWIFYYVTIACVILYGICFPIEEKKIQIKENVSAFQSKVFKPTSIEELREKLETNTLPISIDGAKYSLGGHTSFPNSLHLDLSEFNSVIVNRDDTVTVGSGAIWRDVQEELDKYNLSVGEMQSYNNFSVGGSLSVNCHGRGMDFSTIYETVIELKVMLSNGKIIYCDRVNYPDLFKSCIGGYGAIAIILEATLATLPNILLEREVFRTDRCETEYVIKFILNDKDVVFYNTIIYPERETEAYHVTYKEIKEGREGRRDRLQGRSKSHFGKMAGEQLLRRFPIAKAIRAEFEPKMLMKRETMLRNYEMSYDANELEPLIRFPSTSILQEYFVPLAELNKFLDFFWEVAYINRVNVLNLSIRYVGNPNKERKGLEEEREEIDKGKKDEVLLDYRNNKEETVAIVLYYNMWNMKMGVEHSKNWTRILIDKLVEIGGSYYLPYLPLATVEQFQKCYPNYKDFFKCKRKYDPDSKLNSMFIDKYLK